MWCICCVTVLFLCSCSTPSRHMDLSISVMNISRQHCSWMKSRQISGWISPSSGLQHEEGDRMTGGGKKENVFKRDKLPNIWHIFNYRSKPTMNSYTSRVIIITVISIFRFHHIFTWGNAFMILLNGSNFFLFLSIYTVYFLLIVI